MPIPRIDWYRENQPERMRFDTYLGVYYYLINTERGPLKDPLVAKPSPIPSIASHSPSMFLKQGKSPLTILLRPTREATQPKSNALRSISLDTY